MISKISVLKEVQMLPNSVDRITGCKCCIWTGGKFIATFKVRIQM
jgi:hypothetical protein